MLSLMLSEGERESFQSSDSQSGSIWDVLTAGFDPIELLCFAIVRDCR